MAIGLQRFPVAIVALALALIACSTEDALVQLTYPPGSDARSQDASASLESKGVILRIEPFEDLRPRQGNVTDIGSPFIDLDGLGLHAKNDVREWFETALEQELGDAGFSVVRGQQDVAPQSALVLGGYFFVADCRILPSHRGRISFEAELTKAGVILLEDTFLTTSHAHQSPGADGDNCGKNLSLALQAAIRELIAKMRLQNL